MTASTVSEERITRLESRFSGLELALAKMESTLENIERNTSGMRSIQDDNVECKQKFNDVERRINKLEDKGEEYQKAINNINLKIAMVSGAWTVVLFIISKISS